jgi:hypothetical protein
LRRRVANAIHVCPLQQNEPDCHKT